MFLDLNAYFASIEQQERPDLRGKPIAVVPLITEHTCCIAASYEAKAFGIKTGISLEDAKAACPALLLVEARPKLYVEYHHKIIEAVEHCIPVTSVMSIDEMACKLIGRERKVENATAIARNIKHALRTVGDTLRCSVGLAPNRFLAKVASDMRKPDGLTILLRSELPSALYTLKPSDIPGIGEQMEKRLLQRGISTMEQLCSLSKVEMRDIWNSVLGLRLWYWIRGEDFHDPAFKRKSIGKQHVLAPEFRTREKAYGVVLKLLHIAAENMRKLNMWARGIGVIVHFLKKQPASHGEDWIDTPSWEAHKRIFDCRDTFMLQQYLIQLWSGCPQYSPLQVGVWLYDLIPDELHSLHLFEDGSEKSYSLNVVMDKMNLKYGRHAVYLGGVHDARKSAPTRISFMSIPELNEF